ncbi:hypothetical protein [Pseudonocardia sediminis]|uniref:hypothetical protein n=1 Tax=Pseudonocardia sediminis TaxID=1397368 RepID=UPI0010295B28|nr:hypothetical protein [Pseudonocardia sediminis]
MTESDQNKYFGKATAEAIRLGADMNQAVNARRGAKGLSRPGRLTNAEQQMLRGGKSRGKLERVDVYGRQLYVTDEGTTRGGIAGKRLIAQYGSEKGPTRYSRAKVPRLMPESVLEIADGDRDTAVKLLRKFGYITD